MLSLYVAHIFHLQVNYNFPGFLLIDGVLPPCIPRVLVDISHTTNGQQREQHETLLPSPGVTGWARYSQLLVCVQSCFTSGILYAVFEERCYISSDRSWEKRDRLLLVTFHIKSSGKSKHYSLKMNIAHYLMILFALMLIEL